MTSPGVPWYGPGMANAGMTIFDKALLWLGQKGLLGSGDGQTFTTTGFPASRKRGVQELLGSYQTSPSMRRVTSKIAYSVAVVPWRMFKLKRDATPRGKAIKSIPLQQAGGDAFHKMVGKLTDEGRLKEVTDHPLLTLLAKPNPYMTGFNSRRLTQLYLDIVGEVFWIVDRNGVGKPSEIWVTPPHWVSQTPSEKDPTYHVQWGKIIRKFPAEDVVWMKDLNLVDPSGRGTGIGQALGDEVETDEYAAKFIKTWFINRAKPELLISIEGAGKPALEEAKEKYERQHRGFWNGHSSFWHGGKMTVKELQQKFSDMELVDLRKSQRDVVNHTYGVPPEIMGILENSNRATIDAAVFIYMSTVVAPRLDFLRSEIQDKLVPMFDDRAVLGYESPIPEDKEHHLEVMRAGPHNFDRGEWRSRAGFQDRGTGDRIHHVPVALIQEASPKLDRTLRGAPPARKLTEPVPGSMEALESLRPERLVDALRPVQGPELQAWIEAELAGLGADVSFNMLNPEIVAFLEGAFYDRSIKGLVHDTTYDALRTALIEGTRAGDGVVGLAKRIKEVFHTATTSRARMIARTEVVRASNFGTFTAHKLSGVVAERQWIATLDDRTRHAHMALNGQKVAIGEPFHIGSQTAMYPGDWGVAEMDINCRCTTVAVIKDPKEGDELTAIWRVQETDRVPWEEVFEAAIIRGFNLQEQDVLRGLRGG